MDQVMLVVVSEDGAESLFSTAAQHVPRVGETITYSMEARVSERQDWNESAWEERMAVSGKEWEVTRVHHDFRRLSLRSSEAQVLFVHVRPFKKL